MNLSSPPGAGCHKPTDLPQYEDSQHFAFDLGEIPDDAILAALPRAGRQHRTGAWLFAPLVTASPVWVKSGVEMAEATAALAETTSCTAVLRGDFVGGGWFASLDYEVMVQTEQVNRRATQPTWRLAWHDWVVRRVERNWIFEALVTPRNNTRIRTVLQCLKRALSSPGLNYGYSVSEHVDVTSRARYEHDIARVLEYIRAGDVFQTNYCLLQRASFSGDPWTAYTRLIRDLDPAYGAYYEHDNRAVLSMSPELFFKIAPSGTITVAPIKGTLRRGDEETIDDAQRRFAESGKDRAENVMIVDLLRNDLGRFCKPGSIDPIGLLRIEPHPGVWHLVSTVEGVIEENVSLARIIAAMGPCGSITGAPKIRAMQIIRELEECRRGAYTGTVGHVLPVVGWTEFNVSIRSFVCDGRSIELGVGGGIVADSTPPSEFEETRIKSDPLWAALRRSAVSETAG